MMNSKCSIYLKFRTYQMHIEVVFNCWKCRSAVVMVWLG